jgi:hypothetical protein
MTEPTNNVPAVPEPYNPPHGIEHKWEPSKAILGVLADLAAQPEDTAEAIANRALERLYLPSVVSVGQLAVYSDDDKVRLNAAQFIVSANLQLMSIAAKAGDGPIEKFLKGVEDEINTIRGNDDD